MDLRVGIVSTAAPRLTVVTPARNDIALGAVTMTAQFIGSGVDTATYNPISTQGNTTLVFQIDTLIFSQPFGFFLGTLWYNNVPFAQFTFQYTAAPFVAAPLQMSTTGPYYPPDGYANPNWSGTGIDGAGTFVGLKDTPPQYGGAAGWTVKVNALETGLVFLPPTTGDGTVTEIYTGVGVAGGPITGIGTISLDGPTIAAVALANTAVQGVVAGTNITVNNTDPKHPVISASFTGGVASFNARTGAVVPTSGDYTFALLGSKPTTLAGYGITDAATFAQGAKADTAVQSIVAGTGVTVNVTDPRNPIVSAASGSGTVTSVATGTGLTGGPVTASGTIALSSGSIASLVSANSAVQSVVAGTGCTVDSTNPQAPVVNVTAGGTGTVTSVSVVTASGISGSVASPTTTPAITLTLGAITPSSVAAAGTVTGSNLSGTNTGNQTITLTGDITGSGTGSFATTLATSGVTAGTYGDATHVSQVTVDAKGRVTSAASVAISVGGSGTVTSVAISGGSTGLTTSGGPITTSGTVTLAGTLAIANGGTGATTAAAALTALGGVGLGNTSQYTANQSVAPVLSTTSGTYTPAAGGTNNFQLTLSGNITIANPTGLVDGMVLNFCIDENGTGGYTITLGSLFKWAGGTVPTWVTTAGAKNFFSAYYDGTILRCSGGAGYA